ncbi:MAG: HD domain-containing phosphohydrolase [Eubacteriales bacterium]
MANILIVDSEKSRIIDIGRSLTNEGYVVFFAAGTSEAMDDLKKNPIDVVITDIMPPKMTGLTLLSIVTENYPDIPVILLTESDTIDAAKAAMKDAAFDFLLKPVPVCGMLKSVYMAMRHKNLAAKSQTSAMDSPKNNITDISSNDTLFDAMDSIFHIIGRVLELKDPLSMGHERKVANLSLSIAKKMGLSQQQQDCVYFASFLHDIGKLMIPSEILAKPSKLTACEYAMVKDHVPRGHALIKHINLPWPIHDVIYQHHERVDGSGYPQGLTGDKILLEAKILAVADVIEAMTSFRPYRPRFDIRIALSEILDNCGKLYDTSVCEAVYSLFRDDNYQLDADLSSERVVAYQ